MTEYRSSLTSLNVLRRRRRNGGCNDGSFFLLLLRKIPTKREEKGQFWQVLRSRFELDRCASFQMKQGTIITIHPGPDGAPEARTAPAKLATIGEMEPDIPADVSLDGCQVGLRMGILYRDRLGETFWVIIHLSFALSTSADALGKPFQETVAKMSPSARSSYLFCPPFDRTQRSSLEDRSFSCFMHPFSFLVLSLSKSPVLYAWDTPAIIAMMPARASRMTAGASITIRARPLPR